MRAVCCSSSLPGGVYPGGGLSRGMSAWGCLLDTPLWTEWQTGVKTLPCSNFVEILPSGLSASTCAQRFCIPTGYGYKKFKQIPLHKGLSVPITSCEVLKTKIWHFCIKLTSRGFNRFQQKNKIAFSGNWTHNWPSLTRNVLNRRFFKLNFVSQTGRVWQIRIVR